MKLTKKKIGAGIAGLAIVVGGTSAYAFWTQGGTGNGSATAGTTSAITVNQTTVVTGLYPGGPPVTLSGNFDNNVNPGSVTISSVTAVVHTFSIGGAPACTQADFLIGGAAAGSVVPHGLAVGNWTGLTVQMVNGAGNQDNCKSASITIDYTAVP